nr:hypothetical protein [Candidatus Njordarchaeum guaymaensis]
MSFKDSMEKIVIVFLLLGLASFSIGLVGWVVGLLQRYHMPWEIQLVAIGLVFILLAALAAKLLSRD